MPVMTGIFPLARYIEGDTPVAGSNDDHIASSYTSVSGSAFGHGTEFEDNGTGKRRKTDKGAGQQGAGQQLAIEDMAEFTKNKKGLELCRGFQTGACKSNGSDKHICRAVTSRRHQCRICLVNSHGACDHGYPKYKTGRKWDKGGGKKGDKGGEGKRQRRQERKQRQ